MNHIDRRRFLSGGARFSIGAVAVGSGGVAALLAGCGGDDGGATGDSTGATGTAPGSGTGATTPATSVAPTPGGTLVVGSSVAPVGFDPTVAFIGTTEMQTVYDTLMTIGADGTIEPLLAESLEPSEDFTTWTLALRPGVLFHDGTPLDAAAVVANLESIRSSATAGAIFAPIESVTATDDLTVTIAMNEPWAPFPAYLAGGIGVVLAPEVIANGTANERPIGTGPYKFEEWVVDDHLTVVKNPDYWGDEPFLDRIEYRPITDAQALANSLRAGDIDLALTGDASLLDSFAEDGTFVVSTDAELPGPDLSSPNQFFYLLNTAVAPLDDVRVRRALAHATDREGVVESIAYGLPTIDDGIFAADSPMYTPSGYPEFDPDEARRLVDEYTAEKGPIELTISASTSNEGLQLAQLLQALWAEVGITVEITQTQAADNITKVLYGDFQIAGWTGFGTPDQDANSVVLASTNAKPVGELAINPSRTADDVIDAAFAAGRASGDPAERIEQYQIVQQRLGELVPFLWLYRVLWGAVAGPAVGGVDLRWAGSAVPRLLWKAS